MYLVQITVRNWAKYNPRVDRKVHTWIRFQNNFFRDQRVYGMTDAQIILLQMCWCEASVKGGEECEMNLDYLVNVRKMTHSQIMNDFHELERRGFIDIGEDDENSYQPMTPPPEVMVPELEVSKTITSEPETITQSHGCLRTNVRTYVTNERTNGEGEQLDGLAPSLPILAELWNDIGAGVLPTVVKSNKQRDRLAKQRWNEHSREEWGEVILRITRSEFCTGKNDRGWKATFDWLLQPATALKVLEGKFDNRSGSPPGGGGTSEDYFRNLEQQQREDSDGGPGR